MDLTYRESAIMNNAKHLVKKFGATKAMENLSWFKKFINQSVPCAVKIAKVSRIWVSFLQVAQLKVL